MSPILIIVKKEFLQVMRNRQMLPMIFIIPVVQLIVLVHAATFEIKRVDFEVVDFDKTESSRLLISKFINTNRFQIMSYPASTALALEDIADNKARMALVIPHNFEKDITCGTPPKLQFLINALDGAAAGIINSYSSSIVMDFNRQIMIGISPELAKSGFSGIETRERFWYNPELNYKFYMVPGILVVLVTVIGMFLSSMNIVREKEIGTIEQLNVTPIRKHQFIIGKLVPFWLIALFDLAFGLTLAKLIFDIPILGNILLIFALASVYLLVVLSVGLLISTLTNTQQQAMFVSFFFMILFILMSGLFTPIDSMPRWAAILAQFNPAAHFIEIMRRVMLKGAGFFDVQYQFWMLVAMGVVLISLSTWRYRKTSG